MAANLTRQAVRDRDDILERSAERYGEAKANELRATIEAKCHEIGSGLDLGHARRDVPDNLPFRFIVIAPFVIAYDPGSKLVVRIIDGRRDFSKLFAGERQGNRVKFFFYPSASVERPESSSRAERSLRWLRKLASEAIQTGQPGCWIASLRSQ